MTWKNGKRWVYSVTYDEGCADLLRHVVPLHRTYGIPGHVALVAGQVGVFRHLALHPPEGRRVVEERSQPLVLARQLGRPAWVLEESRLRHGRADFVEAVLEAGQVGKARHVLESIV